jgi:hypothetical protein
VGKFAAQKQEDIQKHLSDLFKSKLERILDVESKYDIQNEERFVVNYKSLVKAIFKS